MSDVVGDLFTSIASGPTVADPSTFSDCSQDPKNTMASGEDP